MTRAQRALDVLGAFFKLGVTSFGGPVAHIGYFREEFVVRRRWLDETRFADLVALCQFLPGPTSSQVGLAIGLMRAGFPGAAAAWAGFTLPSALALLLASRAAHAALGPTTAGMVHGLKLVAVSVVAQAVGGMARTLCPDRARAGIAVASAVVACSFSFTLVQPSVLVAGGIAGYILCRETLAVFPAVPTAAQLPAPSLAALVPRRTAAIALIAFAALLIGLPLTDGDRDFAIFAAFYRSGALVFGGGHVVLPLLHDAVVAPGWVDDSAFLAGYAAAQAVPGPLFTFAAYLGAVAGGSNPLTGSLLGLAGIFLPGALILIAALAYWEQLRRSLGAQATIRGVNAAVVGLLGAALYDPIWTGSVETPQDVGVALIGVMLLTVWRVAPAWVVLGGAAAGCLMVRM